MAAIPNPLYRLAILLTFVGLAYLCLPVSDANSTVDSLAYATESRYGEDMWSSHHLLYTPTLWKITHLLGIENTLLFGKAANALAAVAALAIFYLVLRGKGASNAYALTAAAFCGASFGVARFATENEAYIWPLIPSLLGWHAFTRRKYAVSGNWLGLAICVHQVQVWWLAAFCLELLLSRQLKSLYYLAGAALGVVFFTYFEVIVNTPALLHNPIGFMAGEFASGGVKTDLGMNHVLLWIASLVRTFVQVHGIIGVVVKMKAFWWLALIGASAGLAVFFLLKTNAGAGQKKAENTREAIWLIILLILFSLISQGNAEFLVGLPFAIGIACLGSKFLENALRYSSPVVLGWNITFGLLPLSIFSWYPDLSLAKRAKAEPKVSFFLEDKLRTDWHYAYINGAKFPENTFHKTWAVFIGPADGIVYNHKLIAPNLFCVQESRDKTFSREQYLMPTQSSNIQARPIQSKSIDNTFYGDTTCFYSLNYYENAHVKPN